jgi:hypothetical protein
MKLTILAAVTLALWASPATSQHTAPLMFEADGGLWDRTCLWIW